MNAIPISRVLAGYVQVPAVRKRYRLACPLHQSANPTTFSVFNDELWYCFVCQKGGTAVELLSILEGIPRSEAIERLGVEEGSWRFRRSAWDLSRRIEGMQNHKLEEAIEPTGLSGPQFPLRGLRWPTIKHWGLQSSYGGTYFPFRDVEGRLVGWSIRQAEGQPKYLISPGLKKNGFLYGLHENQERIKARREVILVEGQFDALAVWDAGFPNVCSTLGCHLSKDQVRLLLPWVDRIRVLYDGDQAGREGAADLKCRWQNVFSVELLYLPDGEDPSSIGADRLSNVIAPVVRTEGVQVLD